jgi:thioredoxin-like negative regulator of GroEL
MCDSDYILTGVVDKVSALKAIIANSGSTPVVVLFKMSGCSACQNMLRVFLNYRDLCNKQSSKVIMIIIDGETAKDVFEKYKIESYPQIYVYQNGKEIKHLVGYDTAGLSCIFKRYGLQLTKIESN